jgi:hypothetical protein
MPGLFMLSIQVKSDSCPTQMTPGPQSPGAATVTDTGVVEGLIHKFIFPNFCSGEYDKKKAGCQAGNFCCLKIFGMVLIQTTDVRGPVFALRAMPRHADAKSGKSECGSGNFEIGMRKSEKEN